MNGEVCNIFGHTLKFDIENIQKHQNVLTNGEEVVMSEKLHGTWTCFGFDPSLDHDELLFKGTIITSKGLSDQGLAFKWNEANKNNLYVLMFKTFMQDTSTWDLVMSMAYSRGRPVYVLGETFGHGVQDLQYGLKQKQFLAFGIYIGEPGHGKFMDFEEFRHICALIGIRTVPVLYRGPFSMEIAERFRDGKDFISGSHIREGIVITPAKERTDISIGRVCLKMVSPDYLLRKGETTEFN
jgi:RNA ligase (TIGR02306 family)